MLNDIIWFILRFFYFRFIKSDQNIMMLNLCASLVLAYVVFISSVEQTDNEVHVNIYDYYRMLNELRQKC